MISHAPRSSSPAHTKDVERGSSDHDLVRAARNGDRRAFISLVKRHQNAVGAVAYALTGDLGLSEDVTQETFIVAWRRLGEIQEPERFRGWLFGVARKTSFYAARARKRATVRETRAPVSSDSFVSTDPSPLDRAITREQEEAVWRALARIPERYRVPLVLFYREERSAPEVARALGMSEPNVKQRLIRGRRMLEKHLMDLVEIVLHRTKLGKRFTGMVAAALMMGDQQPASAGMASNASLAKVAVAAALGWAVVGGLQPVQAGRGEREAMPRRAIAVASSLPTFVPDRAHGGASRNGAAPARGARPAGGDDLAIYRFDFEDGTLPEDFTFGHVVANPGRAGSQYALMATIAAWWPALTLVDFTTSGLTYRDTLILKFDYWMGVDGHAPITVCAWNSSKTQNYCHNVTAPTRTRWAHVELPLSLLLPTYPERGPLEAGDPLTHFSIEGGRVGGQPFLVDDLILSSS